MLIAYLIRILTNQNTKEGPEREPGSGWAPLVPRCSADSICDAFQMLCGSVTRAVCVLPEISRPVITGKWDGVAGNVMKGVSEYEVGLGHLGAGRRQGCYHQGLEVQLSGRALAWQARFKPLHRGESKERPREPQTGWTLPGVS